MVAAGRPPQVIGWQEGVGLAFFEKRVGERIEPLLPTPGSHFTNAALLHRSAVMLCVSAHSEVP